MKQVFTHKGWFGFAPVYLANIHEKNGGMQVAARLPWLEFMIGLNAFIFNLLNAEFFPFKITGELNPPVELEA